MVSLPWCLQLTTNRQASHAPLEGAVVYLIQTLTLIKSSIFTAPCFCDMTHGWMEHFITILLGVWASTDVISVLLCLEMFLLLLLCPLTIPLLRYTQNGILHMLDRNKRIKSKPERFQNCKEKFDLVITCEERVYDQVLEGESNYWKFLIDSQIIAPIKLFYGQFLLISSCRPQHSYCMFLNTVLAVLSTLCSTLSHLLYLHRSELKRAGDPAACTCHQCRHSG